MMLGSITVDISVRFKARYKIVLLTLKALCHLRMRRLAMALYDYVAKDIQNNAIKYITIAQGKED